MQGWVVNMQPKIFPPLDKLQLLKKHIIKAKYNFLENFVLGTIKLSLMSRGLWVCTGTKCKNSYLLKDEQSFKAIDLWALTP